MTHHDHTPRRTHDTPLGPLSEGAYLRALADGEIERVCESQPTEDARIACECALRKAVGRVMGEARCPDELRARVQAALAAGTQPEEPGDVVRTPMGDTRSPRFWSGVRRLSAIAAVLLLGAALLWSAADSTAGAIPADQRLQLTSFVTNVHTQAASFGPSFGEKFTARTPADAPRVAADILGDVPPIVDRQLGALARLGYEFVGLGPCHVPGEGKSIHIIYRSSDPQAGRCISVWVQNDTGCIPVNKQRCFKTGCKENGDLVVWRDAGYIVYVFAPLGADIDDVRLALGAPRDDARL